MGILNQTGKDLLKSESAVFASILCLLTSQMLDLGTLGRRPLQRAAHKIVPAKHQLRCCSCVHYSSSSSSAPTTTDQRLAGATGAAFAAFGTKEFESSWPQHRLRLRISCQVRYPVILMNILSAQRLAQC